MSHSRGSIAGLLLAAVVAAVPTAAGAQQAPASSVGFRSGFTEGPGTVAGGALIVESGASLLRADARTRLGVGELRFRVRVAPWAELQLGSTSYVRDRAPGRPTLTGLDDPSVGVKAQLFARPEIGALTLVAGTSAPTGAPGLGARAWQPGLKLIAARPLATGLTVMSNVAYAHAATPTGRREQFGGSVWLGRVLTRRTTGYAEQYAVRFADGGPTTAHAHVGLALLTAANTHLDLHAGVGEGASHDRTLGAGLTQRW